MTENIIPNHPSMSSTFIADTFQNLGLKPPVHYIAMSQKKLTAGKYNKNIIKYFVIKTQKV